MKDDLFDSLVAPYSTVVAAEVEQRVLGREASSSRGQATVIITLSSLPTIGQKPVITPSQSNSQTPTLTFKISQSDVPRFKEALVSRGLVRLSSSH